MNLKTILALTLATGSLLLNARADITNGLVLYFNLNEGSGTNVNDSSGLGNNGTIINSAGSAQWTSGWVVGGLTVNSPIPANTNYISVPDAPTLNVTSQNTFTLAAWVKMPNTQLSGAAVIAKGTGGGGEEYVLDVNANRYRLVVRTSGGAATTLSTTVAPANNLWQHVAAVFDGTNTVSKTIRLYLNGQQNNAVTNNVNFASLKASSNPVVIGCRQAASAAYGLLVTNTTFDEVRIYNRPLSASDVYELYALNGRLPAITTQSRSVTNYVGDYAAFNVGIDNNNSTLPVGYQWQWYGTNLPGATAATLVLTNVQLANIGPYSCVLSNIIGITNSATAYLQVQPLPTPNIASGLVGYYEFDDAPGSSAAADSSGNGNPGALIGYLDYTACWVTGLTNGALSFNADTNALTVDLVAIPAVGTPAPPMLDFYSSQALTLAAWVKGTLPQTNGGAIIAKGTGNGGEQYVLDVGASSGTTYRFYVRDTNGLAWVLNTSVSPNGAWQHLSATFDATNGIMDFYVNGQLVNLTVAPASLNTNSHEVSIGNRQSALAAYNLPFSGAIDDVRLFNRALTSADVAALYAAGGLYPPSFAIQPQGASLYVGQDYTFSAALGGTAPIRYQWKTNGVSLVGATNLTLVLTNVQLANAATYTLWATNAYGFTNSQPAVLQVTNFYLTNMLAAWWTFDDGAGTTAVDSSANVNNGTLINFPGDNSGWVPGRLGSALNFINTAATPQEHVAIPDSPSLNFDGTLQFTLTAWVNGALAQSNSAAIICKGTASGGEQYCLDANGGSVSGAYRFFCRNAAGAVTQVQLTNTPTGQWQHLAVAFDGVAGFIRMYVNGQLVATAAAPASLLANAHEVSIGNRPNTADVYNIPFTGQIDDVRIYTRALSATDVQALYAQAPFLPVVFYTQPVGSARWVGDTFLLSVFADGTPPLTYQWQKGGTNVPGATTSSLLFTNLQLTDAGNYSLQVSNAAGPSNSAIAALSVSVFDLSNTVAYWTFNDGSGTTAADASGNGNPGTLNSFPDDNSEWITGRIAGGLKFNADASGADYVSVPDAPALNFDTRLTFSLAAWVRGPATGQANGASIICKGTGAGGEQFSLDSHTDLVTAGYRLYVYNASHASFALPSTVAPTGRWQHLVGVFDGFLGTLQLYVNGQLVASGAGSTSLQANTHEVSIGNRQSGAATAYNLPFTGIIDDVRIYNRALQSNEVQQLYALAGTLGPIVYTQPQSVTNYAHGSASFSSDADGTGALSYQWLKNGATIPGATTASLSMADLQLADAGSYSVRVTDANTSVLSSNASLTVLPLPAPDLTTELIAYWAFDETNGVTAYDSSGRANDALLLDFPPGDAQWMPGVIGGALHFSNGGDITYTNYRVGTANGLTLDNSDQFTFSFWAKLDPGPTGVNPRFITPINGQNWVLWSPSRGVGFYVPANSTQPSIDTWHHFVVLFNRLAGTYSLFVDGARQVTDAGGYARTDPTSPVPAQWFIGHSENAASPIDSWTGLLDDLRVYNRLLNYNDIQALYLLAGAPRMSVTNNGNSVTVSWPAVAAGFHLQSAGAVTSGVVWSNEPATPVPAADGASESLTFSDQAVARFYRLQKP
jgi:hypothetical protein